MRFLLKCTPAVAIAMVLCAGMAEAAIQRVNIKLGGEYCKFYLLEVDKALKKVPGVKGVDFQTMKNHVIVTMMHGKVKPQQLLSAIHSVRGEGYNCTGRFDGEPGPVQDY
jgi:hypothetical protein